MYTVDLMITSGSHGRHIFQDFIVTDRFYFYCKLSAKHVEQKKEFKGKIPNQYLRIAYWGTQIAYISHQPIKGLLQGSKKKKPGNSITLKLESESSTLID